jgi:hypothetical protein
MNEQSFTATILTLGHAMNEQLFIVKLGEGSKPGGKVEVVRVVEHGKLVLRTF